MSVAALFDEEYYLQTNNLVQAAVLKGQFASGFEHFFLYGGKELRAPNALFNPQYYLLQNPDVLRAINSGDFTNVFEHYQLFGEAENRSPSMDFIGFDSETYLSLNPDVELAINTGVFASALDHFISFGRFEPRTGTGIQPLTLDLKVGEDVLIGTPGDDTFFAQYPAVNAHDFLIGIGGAHTRNTLNVGDFIDGKGGIDTLNIVSDPGAVEPLLLPFPHNVLGIEKLVIHDDIHQSFDFSNYTSIVDIQLLSGRTIDNEAITIKLGSKQSLTLIELSDGDTSSPGSLNDGGISLQQSSGAQTIELSLSGVGGGIRTHALFLDIASQDAHTANIKIANSNYLVFSNSGANLSIVNLTGSGRLTITEALPLSLQTFEASGVSADLNLKLSNGNGVINTGSGNDIIFLAEGSHSIDTGSGSDSVSASGGSSSISTGPSGDTFVATGGSNSIFLMDGDDTVSLFGGNSLVDTGHGSDAVSITGGTNTVDTGPDEDTIIIRGGGNNINTGPGDDSVTVTGNNSGFSSGPHSISTGAGDDDITVFPAHDISNDYINGGSGTDRLSIITSSALMLPSRTDVVNIETLFIQDNLHQSHDFSVFQNITTIELDSGTTVDGSTITTTLGTNQRLKLSNILDGDVSAASLADGGVQLVQPSSEAVLFLNLDNVGPTTSIANENFFLDIAGTGVATLNLTAGNESFVVLSNSGGSLQQVNVEGTGTMAVGTLPNSVTGFNGAAASANLFVTMGAGSNTIVGGSGNDEFNLTGGTNNVQGNGGDDTIQIPNNLSAGDIIDGGEGTDTLVIVHTGLATVPSTSNLTSIERIAISDTIHQTLDFSALSSITGIELDSGSTVDGTTIITTLGPAQDLTLDSIIDGDTASASLADGGITIAQAGSITSLNLTLDDIGPNSATTNENVFIDISGSGVTTANIATLNNSFIALSNSGGALSTINLSGSGILSMTNALPNSVTKIDGAASLADISLTAGTSGSTIDTGSGNDSISVTGGANVINTGSGNNVVNASNGNNTITMESGTDNVTLTGGTSTVDMGNGAGTLNASNGNNTITMGSGIDNATLAGGTNNITTGGSNDQITLSGGTNTVNSGASNDQLTISGGTNNIDTESGNDQITISGGNNTLATGNNNDTISASNGVNNVNTGSGDDQITLTGGTNTVVTGNDNDTINVSGGNNDIDTDAGSDQVVLTGGTNDVNTGNNNDTVTLSGGTETVDMGSGNDTVVAGANLSASDTVNGGDGTSDTLEITSALTDALTARLSNFEILEIKGGGGLTHDITGLTGLTSLKASGALTGAVVITDLAEAAEVDISATIGNDLTINQINSVGGSDTLTVDLSGSNYTTGGSIIAPNIETVTLKTSASGAKTMSGATFANATNVTITATGSNLIINDFTATNITALDVSSSNKIVTITTGADVFSSAFTYSGGSSNESLDFDGATLAAGTVFELGQGQDTLTLNADAVATVVRTSATSSGNALSIRDDATSTNTASFNIGSDTFDYNGSLSHDSVTSVVAASGATLQAAVAADTDATVYVIQDADGDAGLETAINNFADNVGRGRANTLETEAADTGLLSYTGLDSAFGSSDIVLIAIDSETNEDATTANNGGTAVYRFQNSNTSTVDTVLSSELELIGVFQDAALGTVDFV